MLNDCAEWLNKKFSSFESPRKKVPLLRGRVYIFNLLVILYGYFKVYGKNTHTWFKLGMFISLFSSLCNTLITAFYHNRDLNLEQRSVFKRVDYAVIYLFILTCYFPVYLHTIKNNFAVIYTLGIWGIGLCLVFQCLIYDFCGMPKWIRVISFTTFGFANHYLTVALYKSRELLILWDVLFSASLYLLGGICYGSKFPNLIPKIFEHHEFMHLLMIIANYFSMRGNLRVM